MEHTYYQIPMHELGKEAKIPLQVMANSEQVFRAMADEMVECILQNNAQGKPTVFICPVGPVGQYPFFVERVNREQVSLKNVWFFNMDEYLTDEGEWIPKEHRLSFRGFMDRTVYTKVAPALVMPESQRIFPDPKDPAKGDLLLEKLGGADICFGGIGINGHLAFNEADGSMASAEFAKLPTRVLKISPETRAINSVGDLGGALEDMPHLCVTIGIKQILSAKKLRLGVFRDWHRAVVRRAAYGEPTAEFPVTLAQSHPDAKIMVNDVAAKLPY